MLPCLRRIIANRVMAFSDSAKYCRSHTKRSLLSRGGVPLKIQPQPLRVLELLLLRAPGLVTREELSDYVWGVG